MPRNASLLGWAMSCLTLKSKPLEQAPVASESSLLVGFCYIHFMSSPNFCYCHHLWFFNLVRCGQLTATWSRWWLRQRFHLIEFLDSWKRKSCKKMQPLFCHRASLTWLYLFESCELDILIIPNELYMLLLSYY